MLNSGTAPGGRPKGSGPKTLDVSPERYLRIILHRKWLVIIVFVLVSVGTAIYSSLLPNVYTSDTLILVDSQKVPETYVKSTVTGDVRNRLGTLSQQILSSTRLQKIIDNLNLYPSEKKTFVREDLISMMRTHIAVSMVSEGGGQDLQAFRISFSGKEPRMVAQVANELANLFIDENLKAREQQATGTTEFLQNQLDGTRKELEKQEEKLRDFRLKHIGEMPEQQSADLQILGQMQSQLQLEGEALARAEQQKNLTATMLSVSSAGVVDMDDNDTPKPPGTEAKGPVKPAAPPVNPKVAQLTGMLARGYTENHPLVKKLRAEIAADEAAAKENVGKEPAAVPAVPEVVVAAVTHEPAAPAVTPSKRIMAPPINNPVLQTQLRQYDAEIAKHKQEQLRLNKLIAGYQAKLEAIPVREQEITELVRDYDISKAHYSQLLNSQLSAETASQLEIRQKGEKFTVLDPAQPAEKPSSPNRMLLNAGGCVAGLGLGLLLALLTEIAGVSIITANQITESTGIPVLEVIPIIQTYTDRRLHRRRLIMATASMVVLTALASCVLLVYHYRS